MRLADRDLVKRRESVLWRPARMRRGCRHTRQNDVVLAEHWRVRE